MNTNIVNIDSEQSFNGNNFSNFSLKTETFPEIKNVISIEISDVHFFYTSAGVSTLTSTNNGGGAGVTTSSMKFSNVLYRFLTINDIERITYNSEDDNMNSYTTKLLRNNNKDCLEPYPRIINFNQPINIGNLNFSWNLEDGSQVINLINLINNADIDPAGGNERFTFTLTIKSLQNSTLKNYNEMFNFSPEVLQRLAYTKIIEDNNKKDYRKEDNMYLPDNNYVPNVNEATPYNFPDNSQVKSITGDYSKQTQDINNNLNYLDNGNRIQYNYNGFVNGN
jgi:hypothetical protein